MSGTMQQAVEAPVPRTPSRPASMQVEGAEGNLSQLIPGAGGNPTQLVTGAEGDLLLAEDTPERARLRSEVSALRASLDATTRHANEYTSELRSDLSQRAQQALSNQRAGFEQAAGQYEKEARDVIQAEVATERARITSEAHHHVYNASRQIRQEQVQLATL